MIIGSCVLLKMIILERVYQKTQPLNSRKSTLYISTTWLLSTIIYNTTKLKKSPPMGVDLHIKPGFSAVFTNFHQHIDMYYSGTISHAPPYQAFPKSL